MEIQKLLESEIESEIKKLGEIDEGSDTYKATVDGLAKLMDKSIEMDRLAIEREEKAKSRADENFRFNTQLAEDKKDRMIKNCIAAAGIVIPTAVTVWGTLKSLKFEEEGTITTIMGRGFINKLLPKK